MADLFVANKLSAEEALQAGPAFVARAFEVDRATSAFFAAELSGKSIALGAHQRRAVVKADLGASVARRRSGGRAVNAGDGIAYIAIGLRDASVFLPCPRDRVLNRNVRGMLLGLSQGTVGAHYFGRDFVSVDRRPAVYTAWARNAAGNVILEFFVGMRDTFHVAESSMTYPSHHADVLNGKEPTTLAEAWTRDVQFDEVVDRVVRRGYAKAYAIPLTTVEFDSSSQAPRLPAQHNDAFAWSAPRDVPIGFVEAGVRLSAANNIEQVRLAGDYFADDALDGILNDSLRGKQGTDAEFVAAINLAMGKDGAVLEGVASLNTVLDAFRDARTRTERA